MKQTRDFLIRNMPIEVYTLLAQAAKENHRSKTQEAIVALAYGLNLRRHRIQKPKPLRWETKISHEFIEDAIDEGRS